MFETALVAKLQSVASNVYPVIAPENYATPAVVWNRIGMTATNDLEDAGTDGWVDVQVDTYSPRLLEAKQTSRQIVTLLKAWCDDVVRASDWTNELLWADDTTDVALYRVTVHFRFYTAL